MKKIILIYVNIALILIYIKIESKERGNMNLVNKFDKIIEWQIRHSREKLNPLSKKIDKKQIKEIETIVGENIPSSFLDLYSIYNGEVKEDNNGVFFGHKFLSINDIIGYYEFPMSLIKPEKRYIKNPDKSEKIINEIKDVIINEIEKIAKKDRDWNRIEISIGEGSFEGPTIYYKDNKRDDYFEHSNDLEEKLFKLGKEIYLEEKETYNWDDIEIVYHKSGKVDIKRTDYNWSEEILLESIPKNKVKIKYFHIKWIPIFSDHAGNYIGIDLDPDEKGVKGQVIIFGRDEEKNYVLANSLEEFFDILLKETENYKGKEKDFPLLFGKYHIHGELTNLLKIE